MSKRYNIHKQMVVKDKITKLVSVFLIVAILAPSVLLSVPKKAGAFWGVGDTTVNIATVSDSPESKVTAVAGGVSAGANTTDTGLHIKDFAKDVLKQLAMAVARKALQEATKSTVNWINSGFGGNPLYVENPQSFFKDIVKSEVKNMVDFYGYDLLRYPFGKAWAINAINSYKSQLSMNSSYSLSRVINDPIYLKNYQIDFNTGGWNGFLLNTQYPQNNYLGFQMLANEQLSRRITLPDNPVSNALAETQDVLQKGQGFLSPKMCPKEINPKYNDGVNEWKQPSFNNKDWEEKNEYDDAEIINSPECQVMSDSYNGPLCKQKLATYKTVYESHRNDAKRKWGADHTCKRPDGTSGLIATTPGTVVASQITTSLGSVVRNKELAAAMGNSLSAVFDALITHFLKEGLNSLASKVNPPPEDDNWTYDGLTLGSPEEDARATWDSGPDEPIVLEDFKNKISGYDIGQCFEFNLFMKENISKQECKETIDGLLALTDNHFVESNWDKNSPTNPAGNHIAGDIDRTEEELKLMYNSESGKNDPANPNNTLGIYQMFGYVWPKARELDICIPGPDLGWQERLEEEKVRSSKLLEIKASNSGGSTAEKADKVLKELKSAVKFFQDWLNNKIIMELTSSAFYLDAVNDIKELSQDANELTDKRRVKNNALARLRAIEAALNTAEFNEQPAPGSQAEKDLINLWKQYKAIQVDVSNSQTIEDTRNQLSTLKDKYATFAKLMDPANPLGCPAERTAKGWGNPGGANSSYSGATITSTDGTPTNTEIAIFCGLPIVGGDNHESFVNTKGITHKEIPLVNAEKVLEYKIMSLKSAPLIGGGNLLGQKTAHIDIKMKCDTIFNAKLLDYKGDLPGTTNVFEIYDPWDDDSESGICVFPDDEPVELGLSKADCLANGGEWIPDSPVENPGGGGQQQQQ